MALTIQNSILEASFSEKTGYWLSLKLKGSDKSWICTEKAPFEVMVEERAFLNEYGFDREVTYLEPTLAGRGVIFVFEKEGIRVVHRIEIDETLPQLSQQVEIEVLAGGDRMLTGVHYYAPEVLLGKVEECVVHLPGQRHSPNTTYSSLLEHKRDVSLGEPLPWIIEGWLECSPDQTAGLVVIENQKENQSFSCWHYSESATAFPTLDSEAGKLSIGNQHYLNAWLRPGVAVTSDKNAILLTETCLEETLSVFRQACYGTHLVSVSDTPEWFKNARLLQINPYPLRDWAVRLEDIQAMGFDLLYLMPLTGEIEAGCTHTGAYVIGEHYKISSGVGTAEEVKAFVAEAHKLGIRVIIDFIPQGINDDENDTFKKEHPDWLVRDSLGRPFGSHGWGPRPGAPTNGHTYSMDWGNPEYRQFCVDWAMWYMREFDIDGFRCDAIHWKEPNFVPEHPHPAWWTTFGGVRLGEELRVAVKAYKPDAILLNETWGTIFQRSMDASYENGWLLSMLNDGWLKGSTFMTGKEWAQHLSLTDQARPEGFIRANLTSNHDLAKEIPELRTKPAANTVSFVHAFTKGIPFVTWSELPEREDFFKSLMQQRKKLEGYSGHYGAVTIEDDACYAALWTKVGEPSILAVANLSAKAVQSQFHFSAADQRKVVLLSRGEIQTDWIEEGLSVSFEAYGFALIALS